MYKNVHKKKKSLGFTLIEIVIVMVILGILAIVAVPKFLDLTSSAKQSATQAALGAIRSVLAVEYAKNAANGSAAFPSALTTAEFANQAIPPNKLTGDVGIVTVDSAPSGTATHGSAGYWFISTTGVAGAYSDGTVDTGAW